MTQKNPPYRRSDRILDRLMGLHPKVIDLSLTRVHALLGKLGHPERALPPVIHVAGTNGKGSTIAMMRSIAEAAGLNVHVFTSPHLVRFAERLRLAGSLIDEDALALVLEECETVNGGEPITYFEITTVAALLAFSRVPADLCLLETGLGGRLDATNVVDQPLAAAITAIALDHQSFLGDTLAAIATEKAGIIKPGVPVISPPQAPEALEQIEARARALKAPLKLGGRDWSIETRAGDKLAFTDAVGEIQLPRPALVGAHQVENAGVAIATLRAALLPALTPTAYRAGLGWVRWPARLQRLESGALMDDLQPGAELWLDGGHNPAAGAALMAHLMPARRDGRPLYLILGMMANKDLAGYLAPFKGEVRRLFAVPIPGEAGAAPAATIAAGASESGIPNRLAGSVRSALKMIRDTHDGNPPMIVIAGSLYLAGTVLAENGTLPE